MVPLSELFDIRYGHSLELNRLKRLSQQKGGIPFVSRKMGDNGISAYVAPIDGVEAAPAGELTCALSGNGVLSTFLQETPYYTGFHVACLRPLVKMTRELLLYYCVCVAANRYRFSYGRQANRTLKNVLVPNLHDIPEYVIKANVTQFEGGARAENEIKTPSLLTCNWKAFRYDKIFEIKKGYYNKKPPVTISGEGIPFIGATERRNGITAWIDLNELERYSRDGRIVDGEPLSRKLFPGRCVTVSNNGSVGEAFYQPVPFTCTHDVNPLYLKDKSVDLTPALGLFLATVIRAEKYRWGYGRKWRPIRMPASIIRLPIAPDGTPDWKFMEQYILSLPYSSQIQ